MQRMDEEKHVEQLAKHCRVCGNRLQKGKSRSSTYACVNKKEELQLTFGVTVDNDKSEVHPSYFCGSCYLKVREPPRVLRRVSLTILSSLFFTGLHTPHKPAR